MPDFLALALFGVIVAFAWGVPFYFMLRAAYSDTICWRWKCDGTCPYHQRMARLADRQRRIDEARGRNANR